MLPRQTHCLLLLSLLSPSFADIIIQPTNGAPVVISASVTNTLRATFSRRFDAHAAAATVAPDIPAIAPRQVTAGPVATGLYTLPSLPAARSAAPCVAACLVPDTFLDVPACNPRPGPGGDDSNFGLVTDACVCLAPLDSLDVVTGCVSQSCGVAATQSADAIPVSQGVAIAASLYQSYCSSKFPASALSSATIAQGGAPGGGPQTRTGGLGATSTGAAGQGPRPAGPALSDMYETLKQIPGIQIQFAHRRSQGNHRRLPRLPRLPIPGGCHLSMRWMERKSEVRVHLSF